MADTHQSKQDKNQTRTQTVQRLEDDTQHMEQQLSPDVGGLLQRRHTVPNNLTPNQILQLQRVVGNQAVGKMLGKSTYQPRRKRESGDSQTVQRKPMSIPWHPTRPAVSGPLVQPSREPVFARFLQRRQAQEDQSTGTPPPRNHPFRTIQRKRLYRKASPSGLVGPTRNKYANKADKTASLMMPMPLQRMGEASPLRLKRLRSIQRVGGDGSFNTSTQFTNRVHRAKHGGSPLPADIQADFGPKLGSDLSQVRVHTGSESAKLNQQIQAKAFTHGNHIHFGAGQYKPNTIQGKRLIAHEVTHTIQQKSNTIQRDMIQRVINTMGGTWDTERYQSVIENDNPGAEIIIKFTPNELVNSPKIALVQKINKVLNNTHLDTAKVQQRTTGVVPLGSGVRTAQERATMHGHWDRALTQTNPVYGADDLEDGQDIEETALSTFNITDLDNYSNYQLGYNYTSRGFGGSTHHKRDAKLHDKPNMPTANVGSRMEFETAAVSIKGNQKGIYYGSIKWGWEITNVVGNKVATTDIDLIDFEVQSMGTPTAHMKQAATQWNASQTYSMGVGKDTTSIMMPGHDTDNTVNLMNRRSVRTRIQTLETQASQVGVNPLDKKNMEFEIAFLKKKLALLMV